MTRTIPSRNIIIIIGKATREASGAALRRDCSCPELSQIMEHDKPISLTLFTCYTTE